MPKFCLIYFWIKYRFSHANGDINCYNCKLHEMYNDNTFIQLRIDIKKRNAMCVLPPTEIPPNYGDRAHI